MSRDFSDREFRVLDIATSRDIRLRLVEAFVLKDQFSDCLNAVKDQSQRSSYEGYLWDYFAIVKVITEVEFKSIISSSRQGYALWDLHKDIKTQEGNALGVEMGSVVQGALPYLLEKAPLLPEDIYFCPEDLSWIISMTHTYFDSGERYCTKSYPKKNSGQTDRIIL